MRLSEKTIDELYGAIYSSITNARIRLQLNPKDDAILAQVENIIWGKQKKILKICK